MVLGKINPPGLSSILFISFCRYALTGAEVTAILMQRHVKVDGKVRTDSTYPAGYMDVVDIEKTDEHFRLVYDAKGRFVTHRITKVLRTLKDGLLKSKAGFSASVLVGCHLYQGVHASSHDISSLTSNIIFSQPYDFPP